MILLGLGCFGLGVVSAEVLRWYRRKTALAQIQREVEQMLLVIPPLTVQQLAERIVADDVCAAEDRALARGKVH
jgi:hypothetical protein